MIFRPHSQKQQDAILSDRKFTVLGTGIQYGKTTVGAVWLKRFIHTFIDKSDNFLILAPTYKILQQSTLPAFLSVMTGMGTYLKADSVFKVNDGGTVYIRSAKDPDSIVGITNIRAAWADEAGLLSLYAFENLQARCSFKNAPMIFTTSPYSLNWIYKDLIKPVRRGLRDDVCLIQAASNENPYFPAEEFENRKKTMDPRRFKMIYGGEWDRPEGLVLDCFSEEFNICKPWALPNDTSYYAGVDWGYRDPFVIIVRGITIYGDQFEVSEFYKSGLKPSQVIDIMEQKQTTFNIKRFFCDPSRPDMISECQARKIHAVAADNSIQYGIDKYYELINSRKYKIFEGACPHLQDEIDSYHYPEEQDLGPDQSKSKSFELPVDQSNHCIDAARYLTLGTHRSKEKFVPKVPEYKEKQKNLFRRGPF